MTLRERYSKEDLATLVVIIESVEDYTEETITIVTEEMKIRKPDEEELKKIASDLFREKAKSYWDSLSVFKELGTPPKSSFLNDKEVLLILREAYELWGGKREDMSIDPWKYAIGE